MANRIRPIILRLAVTENEKQFIEHKMKQFGTRNFGAYVDDFLSPMPATERDKTKSSELE